MKKYNLKITPLTEQDLTNIGDYIALELKKPLGGFKHHQGYSANHYQSAIYA